MTKVPKDPAKQLSTSIRPKDTGPSIRPSRHLSVHLRDALQLQGKDNRIVIDPGLRRDLERRNEERRYQLGIAYAQLAREETVNSKREALLMKGRRLLVCGYYINPLLGVPATKELTKWGRLHCGNRLCPECRPRLKEKQRLAWHSNLAGGLELVPVHLQRRLRPDARNPVVYRRELDRYRHLFGRDLFGKVFNRVAWNARLLGLEVDPEGQTLGVRLLLVTSDKPVLLVRLARWVEEHVDAGQLQKTGSRLQQLEVALDWVDEVNACLVRSHVPARRLVELGESLLRLSLVTTTGGTPWLVDGLNQVVAPEDVAQSTTKEEDLFVTECATTTPEAAYDAGLSQEHAVDDTPEAGVPRESVVQPGTGPSIRPGMFEGSVRGILAPGSEPDTRRKGWKFKGDPGTLRQVEVAFRARAVRERKSPDQQERQEKDDMFKQLCDEVRRQGLKLDEHDRKQDQRLDQVLRILTHLVCDRDSMSREEFRQTVVEAKDGIHQYAKRAQSRVQ